MTKSFQVTRNERGRDTSQPGRWEQGSKLRDQQRKSRKYKQQCKRSTSDVMNSKEYKIITLKGTKRILLIL